MPDAILLAEAAAFTFGCAVLGSGWFDPGRVGTALALTAATLALALLLAVTPGSIAIDAHALDPAHAWPVAR